MSTPSLPLVWPKALTETSPNVADPASPEITKEPEESAVVVFGRLKPTWVERSLGSHHSDLGAFLRGSQEINKPPSSRTSSHAGKNGIRIRNGIFRNWFLWQTRCNPASAWSVPSDRIHPRTVSMKPIEHFPYKSFDRSNFAPDPGSGWVSGRKPERRSQHMLLSECCGSGA